MIEKLLKDMTCAVSTANSETALVMYEGMEATLDASKFDQRTRQERFLRLLMKCASEGKQKEVMGKFTTALLAAEYYFSIGRATKAAPHLRKAVVLFQKLYGGPPVLSEDDEAIVNGFRTENLKGKYERERNAVKTIQILNGAARKLDIDLSLSELLLDEVPSYYIWKGFIPALVAIIGGMMLALYPFEEYRIARLRGSCIPFWDALQTSEIPCLIIGLSVVVLACIYVFWKGNPTQIKWMSIYSYWRFLKI